MSSLYISMRLMDKREGEVVVLPPDTAMMVVLPSPVSPPPPSQFFFSNLASLSCSLSKLF
jgi:hypothetical protein